MTGTERPIRPRRTTPAARFIAVATATALIAAGAPARAQKGPAVVRDAEIEQLLREYVRSDSRNYVSNGDGYVTVMRRGSVAISLSLDSDTGFRKSNRAVSARQRVASCKQ
jgi:hypothetical protein